jgi:hypothetical protein
MTKQIESQGMRESAVSASAATGSWDPYEVWLNRVKKPREDQAAVAQAITTQTVMAQSAMTPTIRVPAAPDLSETARVRALTLSPSS